MVLEHGRVSIELHALREGEGEALLLLHALGSCSRRWDDGWHRWPGPVYGLDFAGHGRSGPVRGGSYTPEYFLADADLALEQLGDRAALAGAGVGAYVALLLAGARPERIAAALLLPGRGLSGGGARPDFDRAPEGIASWRARVESAARSYDPATDPRVSECERDLRPLDYISSFASAARRLLFSEAVEAAGEVPPWWQAARRESAGASASGDLGVALTQLHRSWSGPSSKG